MHHPYVLLPLLVIAQVACSPFGERAPVLVPEATRASPPQATILPHVTTLHGSERTDNYFWLRDKTNPETIAYLEAENNFTQTSMTHTQDLQEKLYGEMLHRIVEDDSSVPNRKGRFLYYTRTEEGKPYRIYCRKEVGNDSQEEILLDVNALAKGHDYMDIGIFEVSPDHSILAFSVDTNGYEQFVLQFKDLKTGQLLPDRIEKTYYSAAWGNDNATLFYNTVDAANRPYRMHRHQLGTAAENDALVFEEQDDRFFLNIHKTRSGAFVVMTLESAITTEVHTVAADTPQSAPQVVEPRQQGHEYRLDHHGDDFYILSNLGAQNFKLVTAPTSNPKRWSWQTIIEHSDKVTLQSVAAFENHLVLFERTNGLPQLRIKKLDPSGAEHRIPFEEASFDVWPGANEEFNTTVFRFNYTSMKTPKSVFDYDMNSHERHLKKTTPVRDYDQSQYVTERIFAPATDGVLVPISVIRKKDTVVDGSAPMLLYGYGSYGYPYDPSFRPSWFSLLDRGLIIGIAHVRGGGEYGRQWKLDGKLDKKMNTFTDFIACAEHLIAKSYTTSKQLVIEGRSAGGLLMGAVMNMRPDLFRAVVAGVPFVDVVNTMLDETIPLTAIEWEEWGNPNIEKDFHTINAYSPYDNIQAQAYPATLILAGLNDPRVHYWEPAKFTAKLRSIQTGTNPLLLKTNMGAGHGGSSGRYGRLKEIAFEYAFMLDQVGIQE